MPSVAAMHHSLRLSPHRINTTPTPPRPSQLTSHPHSLLVLPYTMPPNLPFTQSHILPGGIYSIRPPSSYEALGYETDIPSDTHTQLISARFHMVLVLGDIPERLGYWRVVTVRLSCPLTLFCFGLEECMLTY
jgi:hypothetical protein